MNLSPNPTLPRPAASPKPLPRASRRRKRWPVLLAALVIVLTGAGAGSYWWFFNRAPKTDYLWKAAEIKTLKVNVVEKGQLESTDNHDIICRVKAGSKGTFASTIRWVIDDGSNVSVGQPLMELDDSGLQETHKTQEITVEKARAEFVKADEELIITKRQNQADVAQAIASLEVAELDLDKFLGFREEPGLNALGGLVGLAGTLVEKGEYRSQHDDVSSRLKQAESDLEAYRERAAWAERQLKLNNYTPYQTRAEVTKMLAAADNLEKLRKEKFILESFTRKRTLTDLQGKVDVARINLDRAKLQAKSKEVQADSDRNTKKSVFDREQQRLEEIDGQIEACTITAPKAGMVVYYKAETSRYSSSQEGMIVQGAQVKEGQKLLRIPDLKKMQVNTKVHESLVARVKGDDRRSTGVFDMTRHGLMLMPPGLPRLLTQSDFAHRHIRDRVRGQEYYTHEEGQKATIRVDAFPNRTFNGRVRTVAAVASSADWGSDVKTYQTLVVIDEAVQGLKPDMNAEVTIHIDDSNEPVLCIPIAAVVGGSENGGKRVVYVNTPDGPKEREVTLGKFNESEIEVKSGLQPGEEVLTNPKAFLGEKAKTREEGMDAPKSKGGPGGAGGEKKKGGDTKKGASKPPEAKP